MFSSMTQIFDILRGGVVPRPAVAGSAAVAALVTATVLAAAPAAAHPAGPAPVRRCATAPAAMPGIAEVSWAQQRYDLPALSQVSDGGGVTVAVVDSGVDATHPQLATVVSSGLDVLDRGGDGRTDCVGHGTAVASLVAAQPSNGSGLRGIAPGVRIMSIRVSDRTDNVDTTGDGSVAGLAAGVRAAVASVPKPSVINLSISTTSDNAELRAAVQAALAADIVVVAAVGNHHDRGNPSPYPASYDGVVGVGAIGPDDQRVATSQVGTYVDIVAPGDRIIAASPGVGHAVYQGTSFAAPFVAGTAALVRARWPQLDRAGVVHRLLATADPAAGSRPSPEYGYGVLNPMRALTEIVSPLAPDVPAPGMSGAGTSSPPVASDTAGAAANRGTGQVVMALTTATALVLAAAGLAGLAVVVPLGRRRRWRAELLDVSTPGRPSRTDRPPLAPAGPAPDRPAFVNVNERSTATGHRSTV